MSGLVFRLSDEVCNTEPASDIYKRKGKKLPTDKMSQITYRMEGFQRTGVLIVRGEMLLENLYGILCM